jgi:hypothetical protein
MNGSPRMPGCASSVAGSGPEALKLTRRQSGSWPRVPATKGSQFAERNRSPNRDPFLREGSQAQRFAQHAQVSHRVFGFAVRCLDRFAESLGMMSRFSFVLPLMALVLVFPNYADAAGAFVRRDAIKPAVLPQPPPLPSAGLGEIFNRCGGRRIRDPKTKQCRGPADISTQPQSYAPAS